ncbi:MAG: glycosyltransferase family 39 protein [Patescibacteria group bacterium]
MKLKMPPIRQLYTWLFVLILAIIFVLGTSSYNLANQRADYVKFSSPDETANYFFAKVYAQTGSLAVFENYNLYASDIVHPRSFRSDWGILKPVSFLGIILIFGTLAKVIGLGLIPFLTPIFGAIGIIFFYLLINKLFSNRRIALISATLLTFFPVYVYYSARSMFHNILFIVLTIIAFYFLVSLLEKKLPRTKFFSWSFNWLDFVYSALAGSIFGLAVMTRASELLWLAPALFIVFIFYFRRFNIFRLIILISSFILALLPMAYWNQALYGSFSSGGYTEMNQSITSIVTAGNTSSSWIEAIKKVGNLIFYFGFKPRQSLAMFYNYVVLMFPWLSALAVLGFVWLLGDFRKFKKKYLVYLLAWMLLSLILILYYGSWRFTDNPDPRRFTIGNSYTRYWLPVYLGAIPLAAYFIDRFSRFLSRKIGVLRGGLSLVIVFAISIYSIIFVMFGSEEGLVNVTYSNRVDRDLYEQVITLTPAQSVIITKYHDKVLFPERRVLMGSFTDDQMNNLYLKLAKVAPLYYLNFQFEPKDLDYLKTRKLPQFGLDIELVKVINKDFALYRLSLKK